jgi:hypothetical protein
MLLELVTLGTHVGIVKAASADAVCCATAAWGLADIDRSC